jgi:hypothetical protein
MKIRLRSSTFLIGLGLLRRNMPFINHVKYLGVIFDKEITWWLHMKCTYRYTKEYIHHGQSTHVRAFGHLNASSRSAHMPPVEVHAQSYIIIFKCSKIQCTYPFLLLSGWFTYRINPSPLSSSNWISRLCMVILEAPEKAQSHVTFLALQLPFSFIIFQMMFHCHRMMNGTMIFEFTRNLQKNECTPYLSYNASIWLRP